MTDFSQLAHRIKVWGKEFGFQQIGITDTNLTLYKARFERWLAQNFQGEMDYLATRKTLKLHPASLLPNTIRIISARIDYLPADTGAISILKNPRRGYVSRYALGRDYHRLIRKRLQKLADRINQVIPHTYRAFCDSAPVLEKAIAEKAGLGWIGKHTNVINAKAGSWFFLGEIYTNLPLPIDTPQIKSHCGSCSACLTICPTQAIVGPYQLDARRCISYLTIELKGSIPISLRPLIGNRIYGCDDCQLVCPWNKFAKFTQEKDFHPRHDLEHAELLTLFSWDEQTFMRKTEGSAIRRIGYEHWQRNIAVALGNAPYDLTIVEALSKRLLAASSFVAEHMTWALQQQSSRRSD